jgi:hypothetical protein|tara:strand:- start:4624 stop:5013 length:390 start_codon:yes stop_codon:yes gene_type:complete
MDRKVIEALVKSRTWSFVEISNMKNTINTLCDEIYNESKLIDRFELIRDVTITERFVGFSFEDCIREATRMKLSGDIAEAITEMLGEATISFGNENNGGNENEISERSVGGKSHKKRTTDEKKNSEDKK